MAEFAPTVTACDADAELEAVDVPATVTDADGSITIGERVIDATAFTTIAVYAVVPDENAGVSVPELSTKLSSVATVLDPAVLVTAMV
jgi:hypothetical protein